MQLLLKNVVLSFGRKAQRSEHVLPIAAALAAGITIGATIMLFAGRSGRGLRNDMRERIDALRERRRHENAGFKPDDKRAPTTATPS